MHLQRRCIGSREAIIVNYREDNSGTASVIVVRKNFDCRIENKEVVAVKRHRARAGDKRAGIQCPVIVAIEIHFIEREAIDRPATFPSAS